MFEDYLVMLHNSRYMRTRADLQDVAQSFIDVFYNNHSKLFVTAGFLDDDLLLVCSSLPPSFRIQPTGFPEEDSYR